MNSVTQPRIEVGTRPEVTTFFDEPTNTLSYVVRDPASNACAVIDSVMNLDYPSGSIRFTGADQIIAFITEQKLQLEWILETHVHADHLSAAPYIQQRLGGGSRSAPAFPWYRKPSAVSSTPGPGSPATAHSSMSCLAMATVSRWAIWSVAHCIPRATPPPV